MSELVSERQTGAATSTIAHEGNPETNTLTISGTLDGTAVLAGSTLVAAVAGTPRLGVV